MQGGNGENDRAGVGGDPRGRSLLLLHPPPAALNSLPTLSRPVERRTAFVGGRRLPTVVPADSRPLSWPPIGALPRNRLASSAAGGASPISPTPRRPTIAASPTAGHTDPALQAFYQLRTPCQNPVIANRCAHRCGNPYSLRMVRCRKGNTDSHVASLLGMTFYENAVSIGRGRAAAPDLFFIRKRGGLAATSI